MTFGLALPLAISCSSPPLSIGARQPVSTVFCTTAVISFLPGSRKVDRIPNGLFPCMERASRGSNQNAKHWSRLANAACGLINRLLLKGDADVRMDANLFGAKQ